MTFTGIMTTEAEIDQKAGVNVSASFTDTMKSAACLQAESQLNAICRYNFSDNYSSLNTDVKYILSDIVASIVAMEAIAYDMSNYTSRIEAEDKINLLRDTLLRNLAIVRDKKVQDFINGAT